MGEYRGDGTSFEVRMDLARRAMSIGYTRDGAGRLMDDAYWLDDTYTSRECCTTHPGCILNLRTEGCEACEVMRQSQERGYVGPEVLEATLTALINHPEAVTTYSVYSIPGVDSDAYAWAVQSRRVDTSDGYVTVLDEEGKPDSRYQARGKSEFTQTLTELLTLPAPKKSKARTRSVHFVENATVKSACGKSTEGDTNPEHTTCGGCKTTRRYLAALHTQREAVVRDEFTNAGIRPEMLVRHRVSGCLGIVRTIQRSGACMGWWMGSAHISEMRGVDHMVFPSPGAMMAAVELITVDDLVTVGSTVGYLGHEYQVIRVSMGEGVVLREIGTWRSGMTLAAAEFAAYLSRGMLDVTSLAPSGAENDPLMVMVKAVPEVVPTDPEESMGVAAVLSEPDQIRAFTDRMVLRAYRTRARTGMNLARNFTATIKGFNALYGTECKSWPEVADRADKIAKDWDAAEGR